LPWSICGTAVLAAPFSGAGDFELDDLGYYYIITGGKYPTGTTPNGSSASGERSGGNCYDATAQGRSVTDGTPGLYRGYSMPNNWDSVYAGYFKIEQTTTVDTMIGYFDASLVPEPGSLFVLLRGLAGIVAIRRRR